MSDLPSQVRALQRQARQRQLPMLGVGELGRQLTDLGDAIEQ